MQQPGGVSLLGQIGLLLFEHDDLAGKLADQDGVEPEFIDRKAGPGQTVEFGKSVSQEHEGAGGFQAEIGHGFGRLIYLQMQPEDGGVGELEDFGSDGGILSDDFADGFDGSRRRFHFQSDTKVEAREAGDPTQFSDQGLSLGTGRPRSGGRVLVQSADQHRDVAWLQEVMMGFRSWALWIGRTSCIHLSSSNRQPSTRTSNRNGSSNTGPLYSIRTSR